MPSAYLKSNRNRLLQEHAMTRNWHGITSVSICAFALVAASSMSESHDQIQSANSNSIVKSIDTSPLMLQPDRHPIFGVENAFPELHFDRPVYLTSAQEIGR